MAKVRAAMKQARQANDQPALRKAAEDLRGLVKGVRDTRTEYDGKLAAILNDNQKKQLAEVKRSRPGGAAARPAAVNLLRADVQKKLNVTPEQKQRMQKLQEDLQKALQAVLTDEQKKQYEEMKKGPAPTSAAAKPAAQPTGNPEKKPTEKK
jgi:hypothetical protein